MALYLWYGDAPHFVARGDRPTRGKQRLVLREPAELSIFFLHRIPLDLITAADARQIWFSPPADSRQACSAAHGIFNLCKSPMESLHHGSGRGYRKHRTTTNYHTPRLVDVYSAGNRYCLYGVYSDQFQIHEFQPLTENVRPLPCGESSPRGGNGACRASQDLSWLQNTGGKGRSSSYDSPVRAGKADSWVDRPLPCSEGSTAISKVVLSIYIVRFCDFRFWP